MYFQIPLMVLVITPALEGLRPAWREAAQNIGAGSWQYWRLVGGPVLLAIVPRLRAAAVRQRFLGLRHGPGADQRHVALTPIQIGSFLNGNVIAGQENLGNALGARHGRDHRRSSCSVYMFLQRRAARWLR